MLFRRWDGDKKAPLWATLPFLPFYKQEKSEFPNNDNNSYFHYFCLSLCERGNPQPIFFLTF